MLEPRMVVIGRRRATYEDLEQVPDDKIGELIDGELIVSPRAANPQARAKNQMVIELGGVFGNHRGWRGRPGGWWILGEPELLFGEDVLVPDIAGWRRERWPQVPDAPHFTDPPDWACEVLGAHTACFDRERKLPLYAKAGVKHVWLVEPVEHRIEVFRHEQGALVLARSVSDPARLAAEPFAEAELDVSRWWLAA